MGKNLREIEFVENPSTGREVSTNTIVVGVPKEALENARYLLTRRDFCDKIVGEIHGFNRSTVYLVDGMLVEKTFEGESTRPSYSLRLIAEKEKTPRGNTGLGGLAKRLGLPVPDKPQCGKFYRIE